jgi:excinuclease ABC subunit A
MSCIRIRGARQHNLKNIDVDIPRDRLTVITGVSGSGKSSLAFDTLFAEGQRRYLEALSGRRRQYVQPLDKPDVDEILGLSPAIAIEQKRIAPNPRSTVGTLTEIHDYLRVLFARLGTAHCPQCGQAVSAHTIPEIVAEVARAWPEGSRLLVLAPLPPVGEGKLSSILARLRKDGFARIRLDGTVVELDSHLQLPRRPEYRLEVVVDRVVQGASSEARFHEDVELALKSGDGTMVVADTQGHAMRFTDRLRCASCRIEIPDLSPALFSFHHPQGMCPRCAGLGAEPLPAKAEGRSSMGRGGRTGMDRPSPSGRGSGGRRSSGSVDPVDLDLEGFDSACGPPCSACGGSRLNPAARAVRLHGSGLHDVSALPVSQLGPWLQNIPLNAMTEKIAGPLVSQLLERGAAMERLGLGYLCLDRSAVTLSGGEAQRVRIAQQIGARLTGILYVLDEPSIGLHPQDHRRLMEIVLALRDAGNTVVIVEHDRDTILEADHLIDMGPGAGRLGGQVIFSGPPGKILACPESLTGQHLSGSRTIRISAGRVPFAHGSIEIHGATGHNLKDISIAFPLGCITCVTGVSGSGKSTLVLDTFYRILAQRLYRSTWTPAPHREVRGLDAIRKVLLVDQSAIGRNPRSTPATYTGIFTPIRQLFSRIPEARARGYTPDRFSYNVKGGRCESCKGDGTLSVDLVFLPDVTFTCPVCQGARYNSETLQVQFKGNSIAGVLSMSVTEALALFTNVPAIRQTLKVMEEVGLGYLLLGQSALTLSGGESQRVKLAAELSLRSPEPAVFILDEPTSGLHFEDIARLMDVLQRLAEAGHTVVLIEHHLDVIRCADYVIDLGPVGGEAGGHVVAQGTPAEVASAGASVTGRFLRHAKNRSPSFTR